MVWALNGPAVKRHSDRVAEGNAQKTVTLGELAKFPIPCPEDGEQEDIARAIESTEEILIAIEDRREKLLKVKRGLMHDLLTGEVSVPVPEAEDHG